MSERLTAAPRLSFASLFHSKTAVSLRVSDWAILLTLWLVAAWYSAPTLVDELLRDNQLVVPLHAMRASQFADTAVWMLLLVPLFSVFDATPIALRPVGRWTPARISKALSALGYRAVALVGAGVIHGAITWGAIHAFGTRLGVSPQLLEHDSVALGQQIAGSISDSPLPLLIYWVLARITSARSRRQHTAVVEQSLNVARERALSAELQPHFLFNALNGIALLIRVDPVRAERMIVQLSSLLRETMVAGAAIEHSLDDEIKLLTRYLELQRMRFGDRLTYEFEISASDRSIRVPALILQPVVENAIRHGIEHKPEGGKVVIAGGRITSSAVSQLPSAGDWFELSVSDNGVGIDAASNEGTAVGLRNTRERLHLASLAATREIAQVDSLLVLSQRPDGGTVATMLIPCSAN